MYVPSIYTLFSAAKYSWWIYYYLYLPLAAGPPVVINFPRTRITPIYGEADVQKWNRRPRYRTAPDKKRSRSL